jgi:hypothetical protein
MTKLKGQGLDSYGKNAYFIASQLDMPTNPHTDRPRNSQKEGRGAEEEGGRDTVAPTNMGRGAMTRCLNQVMPAALLLMAVLASCSQQEPPQYYDDDVLRIPGVRWEVPPQVVYRIDDHRFVSLEDYNRCFGDVFYNDTLKHTHTHLFVDDPRNYRGRLIIDDPTGMNIVVPTAANGPCDDHTCSVPASYSTDGGLTFTWVDYIERSTSPSRDSEGYTIAVTKDRFYVKERWGTNDAYVSEYPLIPGIDLKNRIHLACAEAVLPSQIGRVFLMAFIRPQAMIISLATNRSDLPIFRKKSHEKAQGTRVG